MIAALTLPVAAQPVVVPTVAKPTTEIAAKNCVTAECHAGVKQHEVLHGPVNVDACDACHTLTNAALHEYTLVRKPTELCTFCHVVELEGAAVVHEPLKTGQCLECHNPHGGFDRGFLRGRTMGEFCAKCHVEVVGESKHVHGPVAAGACAACHAPHASNNDNLLLAKGRELCLGCHVEMGEQLEKVRFKHEAVEGDCTSCHDPHASDFVMMVKAAPLELCTTSCHEDVRQAVFDAPHKHSAVTEERGCANCHNAHGGDLDALMIAEPAKLCLNCHAKPVKDQEGRTVAAVSEILNPELVKHGPVKDGSCGGCHEVHGSKVDRLLTTAYPEKFYAPFEPSNYALCFTCHDNQLVTLERTDALTNFRNGEENLHFVHVNKAEKGRTCRACHNTHASTNPLHIRESVPYGNWSLPIQYERTATGGSCTPGCHQELGYDRANAITTPDLAPATPAGPASTDVPAPAEAPAATPQTTREPTPTPAPATDSEEGSQP